MSCGDFYRLKPSALRAQVKIQPLLIDGHIITIFYKIIHSKLVLWQR